MMLYVPRKGDHYLCEQVVIYWLDHWLEANSNNKLAQAYLAGRKAAENV
jgi:hypothetical protein